MRFPSGTAPTSIEHFGERVRASKFGPKMTGELYAYPNRKPKQRLKRESVGKDLWNDIAWGYRDEDHVQHSGAYLVVQRDRSLRSFDLSMGYFAPLDPVEIEVWLEHVLAKVRTFEPVKSLSDWDGLAGAYVMVFEGFRQFYVGKADEVRKRIKQYWTGRKFFDRILFGTPYESIFPVDELRAWTRRGSMRHAATTRMRWRSARRTSQTDASA